jgi:hypothetical protein
VNWQPIETAPRVPFGQSPIRVLLHGPGIGIATGRACSYDDGYLHADVSHVNGNLVETGDVTHWMPLPDPPGVVTRREP